MDQKRVSEWELAELNPGKQFLTDFLLSANSWVVSWPISFAVGQTVGHEGLALLCKVAEIHGVYSVKISAHELRVYKLATHSWEELTPKIRAVFKQVYGDNIKFTGENPVILAFRRLKVELKN